MQCLIVLLSIILRWRQQPPGCSRCWAGGWSLESYLLTASTFQGEPKVFFTLQGGFEPLSFNWRTGEQTQYLGGICGTIWCSPGHTKRSTFLFVGLLYIYICKYIIMRLCLWPSWWHTNPCHLFNIDIFLSTIPIAGGLQGGDASALPHQGASIPINSNQQLNNLQFTSNMWNY